MRIAVYAIAKDESTFVKAWADSCEDADYRILIDTGSTDDTSMVAELAGVTVHRQTFSPWRFDVARNHALGLVPEDVDLCISLDLDEVLVPGWREALERAYSPEVTRYRYLYTWSWNDDGQPGLQYSGDKIHARNGYTWRYPVHEVLVNTDAEVQGWTDLEIHHHRDQGKARDQYLPLLELAVAEDPANDRNAHYLAREYMYYERFDEAAQEFKRHLALPSATWDAERSQSLRYLASCEPERAEYWLGEAITAAPTRREARVDLALLLMREERWLECLAACQSALALDRRPKEYLTEAHAWGSVLDDTAANAAFQLHQWALAIGHGERALALEPSNPRLQSNLTHYRQAATTWGRALDPVEIHPTSDPAVTSQLEPAMQWRQLPVTSIVEISLPADMPEDWALMNPSIATDGRRLRMVVRAVNYRLAGGQYRMAGPDNAIRSRTGILDVAADGAAENWHWIDDSAALCPDPAYPVHGVEDMRLFHRADRWWVLGAIRDFSASGATRQVLAELAEDPTPHLVNPWRLPSPLSADDHEPVHEKNWTPLPQSGASLEVLWSSEPLVRLRLDSLTKQVVTASGRPSRLIKHERRGSTPTFTTPHGLAYVTHTLGPQIKDPDRPRGTYLHSFVTYCGDHVHVGPTWTIQGLALEYVAGACHLEDRLYLSFGRDDCRARLAISDWVDVAHLIPMSCDRDEGGTAPQ